MDELAFYQPPIKSDALHLRLEVHVVGLEQQNRVRKIYENTNSASKAGFTTSLTSTEDWKI